MHHKEVIAVNLMKKESDLRNYDGKDLKLAMHVSFVSIVINIILSSFKLTAGILAHSGAMISDAIHSASDVFSTFIVIIGVNIADKQSDQEHPYGHERMECVASILLAAVLFATGMGILLNGIEKIIQKDALGVVVPGSLALVAAVISIAVKEWMYWYTRAAAKKINSGALMADAWHHRSDALSSIGSFAGILGARLGFPVMDPAASIIISIFIGKAAADIFKDAMDKMVDKSCDQVTVMSMKKMVLEKQGVEGIDELRTRLFGAKVYVDIEISADENLSLKESHQIAEEIHGMIESEFTKVKHCMVHVNPLETEPVTEKE